MGQGCAILLILWALLLDVHHSECFSAKSPVLNIDSSHPVLIQALNKHKYFGFSVALAKNENKSW